MIQCDHIFTKCVVANQILMWYFLPYHVEMDVSRSHPGMSTGWIATRILDSVAIGELLHINLIIRGVVCIFVFTSNVKSNGH